jgi:hypothetical protein
MTNYFSSIVLTIYRAIRQMLNISEHQADVTAAISGGSVQINTIEASPGGQVVPAPWQLAIAAIMDRLDSIEFKIDELIGRGIL